MVKLNQVCFATLQFEEPWTLENYRKVGGYEAWSKIINEKIPPTDIIEIVKESGLRGRGGVGFRDKHDQPSSLAHHNRQQDIPPPV